MNKFYNAVVAEQIEEYEVLMQLVNRVDADPAVIDTLPLTELEKLNKYYDELIKQKEKLLKSLIENQ